MSNYPPLLYSSVHARPFPKGVRLRAIFSLATVNAMGEGSGGGHVMQHTVICKFYSAKTGF